MLAVDGSGNDRTDIYVAYEQQTGKALVVYGKGTDDVYYRVWNAGWVVKFPWRGSAAVMHGGWHSQLTRRAIESPSACSPTTPMFGWQCGMGQVGPTCQQ